VLGFEVTAYGSDFALPGASFLATGDYHHHIGLNISDPDGNGIELYYDRPREEWGIPKAEPFDPRDLLVELGPTT
jgi:catechol-2,3-dioxygenase